MEIDAKMNGDRTNNDTLSNFILWTLPWTKQETADIWPSGPQIGGDRQFEMKDEAYKLTV